MWHLRCIFQTPFSSGVSTDQQPLHAQLHFNCSLPRHLWAPLTRSIAYGTALIRDPSPAVAESPRAVETRYGAVRYDQAFEFQNMIGGLYGAKRPALNNHKRSTTNLKIGLAYARTVLANILSCIQVTGKGYQYVRVIA